MSEDSAFLIGAGIFFGLWVASVTISKAIIIAGTFCAPISNKDLDERGKSLAEGLK